MLYFYQLQFVCPVSAVSAVFHFQILKIKTQPCIVNCPKAERVYRRGNDDSALWEHFRVWESLE